MVTTAVATLLAGVALMITPVSSVRRLRGIVPSKRSARPAVTALLREPRWRPVWASVAAALLTIPIVGPPYGFLLAVPIGGLTGLAMWALRRRRRTRPSGTDADARLAVMGDLLAACLQSGLPVPTAVRAVAGMAPAPAAGALRRTADLLALGAEPADAWAPSLRCPATTELARAARRTARSGSALAGAASTLAERARSNAVDSGEARAQRAAVLIVGPLGLCFLPAFLCLGVIPVVIGLASHLTVAP
jgi:pilus assembly protein TadC